MARMMKKRIFSGAVCEQIVYLAPDNSKNYDPERNTKRKRFQTEEEYEKFKTEIARRRHYRLFQANFRAGDLFSTLTFDQEHEVTDFIEARNIRNRWRRKIKKNFPDAVFFIYMGRGKSTHRIHFHMVSHGIPEEWIKVNWEYGAADRVVQLRKKCKYDGVDMGMDYQGLANYLFNHWKKEQGGHRFFATKNAKKSEEEAPKEIHIKYTYSEKHPPRPPKGYRLTKMEQSSYGWMYFRYVADEKKSSGGKPVEDAL